MKERGLRVKEGEGGQEGGQVDVAGIWSLTYTSRCQDLPLSLLRRRRRISKPVQTENESFRVGFPLLAARARARWIKLQVEFLTIRVSQKVGVCTWQQLCAKVRAVDRRDVHVIGLGCNWRLLTPVMRAR